MIKSLLKYPRGYFLLPSSFDSGYLLLHLALSHGLDTSDEVVLMPQFNYFVLKLAYLEKSSLFSVVLSIAMSAW